METFLFDVLSFCFEVIKAILLVYFFIPVIILRLCISVILVLRRRGNNANGR